MGSKNSKPPLVSVIIATYNRAHIISQSIESVLQQTFKDYEIVVVDDGSSDHTEQLLRDRYAGTVVYIRKEKNEGLSAARNTGVKRSRGHYVAILDDDDCWLPEKLEMQMELFKKQPSLGIVYCNSLTVNDHDEVLGEIRGTKRGAIFAAVLSSNCLGPPSGVLLSRKVFTQAGYFDEKLTALEDWDLWIRVSRLYDIDFVDQPLVRYRVHGDNMSKDIENMQRSTFTVLDKYWPGFCESKEAEEERNRVYSNHCVNFAWKQYSRGNRAAFRELMEQALAYDPLHQVVLRGDGLPGKEQAFFEVFDRFWKKHPNRHDSTGKKRSYRIHYIQLAWEYYHRYDMKGFRRSIAKAFYYSFPRIPVRLMLPFVTSFLGKESADGLHRVRERVLKGKAGI